MTDADCAAFTDRVPTELNLRFAELISLSDSALFISAAPGILTPHDEERLMQAFRRSSLGGNDLEPELLQSTRLCLVMELAECISSGISCRNIF